MNRLSIAAMPGNEAAATALAQELDVPAAAIAVHRFPDGESLVRVPEAAETVILYCTLDDPDRKLVRLMLAAAAHHDCGARRLVLVAPYLCYMRQDVAFHSGEAVSQQVVGRFLAERFDRVVTVDPHLHRTPALDTVFPGIEATALSAAPVLAGMIQDGGPGGADANIAVGPDAESAPWVAAVAAHLGWPTLTASKIRHGDRDVRITIPEAGQVMGRTAWLIDDVVASGGTLAACARELRNAGAHPVEAVAVHALCSDSDLAALKAAGISRFRSTDSVPHSSNAACIAPLLASALRQEIDR